MPAAPLATESACKIGGTKSPRERELRGHDTRRLWLPMQRENTSGLCECGCGGAAPIARQTVVARGWTKGQPVRFIRGHRSRLGHKPPSAETRAKISAANTLHFADPEVREAMSDARKGIPRPPEVVAKVAAALTGRKLSPEHCAKLSEVRTGREVTPAMRAAYDRQTGDGHAAWKGEDAGYHWKHQWLSKRYPKAGICSECGEARKTEWAFLRHPEQHSRNVEDYREMCVPCHRRMDYDARIERLVQERLAEMA